MVSVVEGLSDRSSRLFSFDLAAFAFRILTFSIGRYPGNLVFCRLLAHPIVPVGCPSGHLMTVVSTCCFVFVPDLTSDITLVIQYWGAAANRLLVCAIVYLVRCTDVLTPCFSVCPGLSMYSGVAQYLWATGCASDANRLDFPDSFLNFGCLGFTFIYEQLWTLFSLLQLLSNRGRMMSPSANPHGLSNALPTFDCVRSHYNLADVTSHIE